MWNHGAGYALHQVIALLEREGVWESLGPVRTREMILKFLEIGNRFNCSDEDILDDTGPRYRICAYCYGAADEYRDLLCPTCYARWSEALTQKLPTHK